MEAKPRREKASLGVGEPWQLPAVGLPTDPAEAEVNREEAEESMVCTVRRKWPCRQAAWKIWVALSCSRGWGGGQGGAVAHSAEGTGGVEDLGAPWPAAGGGVGGGAQAPGEAWTRQADDQGAAQDGWSGSHSGPGEQQQRDGTRAWHAAQPASSPTHPPTHPLPHPPTHLRPHQPRLPERAHHRVVDHAVGAAVVQLHLLKGGQGLAPEPRAVVGGDQPPKRHAVGAAALGLHLLKHLLRPLPLSACKMEGRGGAGRGEQEAEASYASAWGLGVGLLHTTSRPPSPDHAPLLPTSRCHDPTPRPAARPPTLCAGRDEGVVGDHVRPAALGVHLPEQVQRQLPLPRLLACVEGTDR